MADYLPGEDISTGRLSQIYRRAITGKWGVSEDLAKKAIDQLESVLKRDDADPALKVSAAKTLMAATKLELDEIRLNLDISKAGQGDDVEGSPTGKSINQFLNAPESGQEAG